MATEADTDAQALDRLIEALLGLRATMLEAEHAREHQIAAVHPDQRASARNLVHYVALRRRDVRELQQALSARGLSSLGRSEPNILASVDAVLATLGRLRGRDVPPADHPVALGAGDALLERHADLLLGPAPAGRSTRIMVTMPSEAADDPAFVAGAFDRGADLARVNCAHDGPDEWRRMIDAVRATGDHRVAMDLAGPKLRTGPLAPGPRVLRLSPRRDALGRVLAPARAWLVPEGHEAPDASAAVPVQERDWLAGLRRGDGVSLTDSREANRSFGVVLRHEDAVLVETDETTYLATGLALLDASGGCGTVGTLPEQEQHLSLRPGDHLVLTRDLTPAPVVDEDDPQPARVGCTLPEAFHDARPGERVFLDDGKVAGRILRVDPDEIEVEITSARKGRAKLRAEKGINLPDTELHLEALTDKDVEDVAFIARHGDIVNLSFVREPSDVELLQRRLAEVGGEHLGIVLKVETEAAFHHLDDLLLTAMRSASVGVMIARGDLAVETGYERLAEVQEEILWLCEAGHVPVIWATQVLDTLAKTGRPSRAEVTDAAMGERAECVMLNKGPHIEDAITVLADILARMDEHQHKKRGLLRRLRAWDRDLAPDGTWSDAPS